MGSNIGGDLNQLVAETPQSQMGKKGVVGTGLSTEEEPHGAAVLSSRGPEWTEMAEENRRLLAELAKLKEQGSHMGRGRSMLRSRLNRSKSKSPSILLLIFHSICLPSSSKEIQAILAFSVLALLKLIIAFSKPSTDG